MSVPLVVTGYVTLAGVAALLVFDAVRRFRAARAERRRANPYRNLDRVAVLRRWTWHGTDPVTGDSFDLAVAELRLVLESQLEGAF